MPVPPHTASHVVQYADRRRGCNGLRQPARVAAVVQCNVRGCCVAGRWEVDDVIRDAWGELPAHREDRVWDRFTAAFRFAPSVSPDDWPSFEVPAPSITWD